MKAERSHRITNDYRDVRLISLAGWIKATETLLRDERGPYLVSQEGYDPSDPTATDDEFVLGRSGQWTTTTAFFTAPKELRSEFMFGTAAEVMTLFERLPSDPKVLSGGAPASGQRADSEAQSLRTAFEAARRQDKTPSAQGLPPNET